MSKGITLDTNLLPAIVRFLLSFWAVLLLFIM